MKTNSKVTPHDSDPVDLVMQAARRRHCPIAPLTSAVTEAVAAGMKHGTHSTEARKARALHRRWEKLLRRHLLTIWKIRLAGECLVEIENEITAFAAEHGLRGK
jgi:hypothetical protein